MISKQSMILNLLIDKPMTTKELVSIFNELRFDNYSSWTVGDLGGSLNKLKRKGYIKGEPLNFLEPARMRWYALESLTSQKANPSV